MTVNASHLVGISLAALLTMHVAPAAAQQAIVPELVSPVVGATPADSVRNGRQPRPQGREEVQR